MATAKLSKWGNSSAIRIPNQIVKRLNLAEGSEMQITITSENEIVLRPTAKPQEPNEDLRKHLNGLLSQMKTDSPRHEEIDFGIEGDEKL